MPKLLSVNHQNVAYELFRTFIGRVQLFNWHVHAAIAWAASVWGWTWNFNVSNTKKIYKRTLVQRFCVFDTHAERSWCRSDTCVCKWYVTGVKLKIEMRKVGQNLHSKRATNSTTEICFAASLISLSTVKLVWNKAEPHFNDATDRALHSRGLCGAW